MARFIYRLRKVFEIRERRVKEQEQHVIRARNRVAEIKSRIEKKRNEVVLVRQNMMTAPHTLMASHDDYIQKCYQQLDEMFEELREAEAALLEEAKKLAQYQADLKALEKHKEKAHDEWKADQKQIEMKKMDEVASQRYFRDQLAAQEEAAEDEARRLEELEEAEAFE